MTGRWNWKIRVLAADDSQAMRSMFHALFKPDAEHRLEGLPEMELCGVARDGVECLEKVRLLKPDVLLLDLEMPRMHGLEVLSRLRVESPMLPAILCSASTARGAQATLDGLARGAADYVTKPAGHRDAADGLRALAEDLLPKIAALSGWSFMGLEGDSMQRGAANTPLREQDGLREAGGVRVVAIGVSTGGPSALEQILRGLPAKFAAPVVIVQHMPRTFTAALAARLDRSCALHVREAYEGAAVLPGTVWIAPGDMQMEVIEARDGFGSVIHLDEGDPASQHKPAADHLFFTVAKRYGAGTLALVMTGMGSDGLAGARAVHRAGGTVLIQDAATSAVWGMPARVAEAGIASATLPLGMIAGELVRRVGKTEGIRLARPAGGALTGAESGNELF